MTLEQKIREHIETLPEEYIQSLDELVLGSNNNQKPIDNIMQQISNLNQHQQETIYNRIRYILGTTLLDELILILSILKNFPSLVPETSWT